MSDLEPVWCIRRNDGWCAAACGHKILNTMYDSRTLCNRLVVACFGQEERLPNCEGCLEVLRRRTKKARVKAAGKKQGELF